MPKITFKDGRWIDLRLPTVDEYLDIQDLPLAKTKEARDERLRFWRDTFKKATRETSWGGTAGDITLNEMLKIVPQWLYAVEDDAVPPAFGSSSDTASPKPRSRRPVASGRRSSTRASSKS